MKIQKELFIYIFIMLYWFYLGFMISSIEFGISLFIIGFIIFVIGIVIIQYEFNKQKIPEEYLYVIVDNLILKKELHYLKYRLCFNCKIILNFYDYYLSNIKFIDSNREKVRNMIQLWNNEKIELYCCLCNSIKKLEMEEGDN